MVFISLLDFGKPLKSLCKLIFKSLKNSNTKKFHLPNVSYSNNQNDLTPNANNELIQIKIEHSDIRNETANKIFPILNLK